jgi:NAD(P)H dehydrogenase (quinone)
MILAFKSTGAVKMSKPRILVTGATGKTGLPTALGLLEKGFPVRTLVKTVDARAERLRAAGAEITCGSLENFRDLETSMQGMARAYFCPRSRRGRCAARPCLRPRRAKRGSKPSSS